MIKVYSIIGEKNNVVIDIPFGKAKIKVEFQGGNVFRGIPAKLYTKDPFIEMVLEKSDLNGKLFRLLKVIPEESDKMEEVSKQSERSDESEESTRGRKKKGNGMKFGDAAEAIEYIATKYGEQVETGAEAITYLKAQGINAVIG